MRSAEPVLTVKEMRAAERAAMVAGTSERVLMQRAGAGAAEWVWRAAAGRAVTVLCGPGNNGGDGYVIAECLRRRGSAVTVVAPAESKSDTARQARGDFAGEVTTAANGVHAPVLVDCLFGSGLTRTISGAFAKALEECAASHSFKIAIDVPSGVEADSGAILGPAPQFDLTLALGAWKRAHFLMPAAALMGAMRLVPLGITLPADGARLSRRPQIAAPAADAHKYTRGLVTIVGGAMPGAAVLAARGAMSGGAGYVRLLSAHSHPAAPAELVVQQGELAGRLEDARISAVLVGPGLGRDAAARAQLAAALATGKPCVLDADALHLLDRELLVGVDPSRLLATPHDGELARLCATFDVTTEAGKLERAHALHAATGMTVVAKGPDTILAGADGMRFFPRGSSWLSVAGTGDVFAGIAAARLAGGAGAFAAAQEAVWLHHEAARIAGPAFAASELAAAVKPALARLL